MNVYLYGTITFTVTKSSGVTTTDAGHKSARRDVNSDSGIFSSGTDVPCHVGLVVVVAAASTTSPVAVGALVESTISCELALGLGVTALVGDCVGASVMAGQLRSLSAAVMSLYLPSGTLPKA